VSRQALGFEVPTHVLRHTAIATLNDATHDLRAAQEFARHLSPETTVLYTRVSRRRLIEAVAAIDYAA
jgi:site-specific recombinase XerD